MGDPDFSSVLLEEQRLRSDIETARLDLANSIVAISDRVADKVDWRTWVRRRPLPAVLGGLAVGFLVGRLSSPRKDER